MLIRSLEDKFNRVVQNPNNIFKIYHKLKWKFGDNGESLELGCFK